MSLFTIRIPGACLVGAIVPLLAGCEPASTSARDQASAGAPAAARIAARVRSWDGPRVLGVPVPASLVHEDSLAQAMRAAWSAAGENPAIYELRFGERILSTDEEFDVVREFYLPVVTQVFMDHEMTFPGLGRQRMFTGLVEARDGTLVKLTLTRPFYVYPTSDPLDRTFLQVGKAGVLQAPQQLQGGTP